MTNEQWIQKYSPRAWSFHHERGEDEETRAFFRGAYPKVREYLDRTQAQEDRRQAAREYRVCKTELVELRCAQAQDSADTYGTWERDDLPFLDFSKNSRHTAREPGIVIGGSKKKGSE